MIVGSTHKQRAGWRLPRLAVALSTALVLGACAGGNTDDLLSLGPLTDETQQANLSDPVQAVAHYGRLYASRPSDRNIALNYAQALTDTGDKRRAFTVLRAASAHHKDDPEFASAFGRAALANGQVALATTMLDKADTPDKPDWRTVSALGTAYAQQGKYDQATNHFQRALRLAPGNPSVMNNLAMAKAATGDLKGAENLLRKASLMPIVDSKVRKNLALVLRLQGRTTDAANVEANPGRAMRSTVAPSKAPATGSNQLAQAKPK